MDMSNKSSRQRKRATPTNPNAVPAWNWVRSFTDRTKRVLTSYVAEFTKRSQDPPTTPITRSKVQRQLSAFKDKLDDLVAEFDLRYAEFSGTGDEPGDPDFAGIHEALNSMANGGFHETLRKIRDEIGKQMIKASQPLSSDEETAFWKSVADFLPAVRTMIEACRRAKQLVDALIRSGKHASSPLERKLLKSGELLLGEIISTMERCMDVGCPYDSVRDDAELRGHLHPSVAERLASASESVDLYLTQLNSRLSDLTKWIASAEGVRIDVDKLEMHDLQARLRSHLSLDATVFTAAKQLVAAAIRLPAPAAADANAAFSHLDRVTAAHRDALATLAPAHSSSADVTPVSSPPKLPYNKLNKKEQLVIDYLYDHESMPAYTISELADPLFDLASDAGVRMREGTLRSTLSRLAELGWVDSRRDAPTAALNSPPTHYSLAPAGRFSYSTPRDAGRGQQPPS
jgi:hypothetical protein